MKIRFRIGVEERIEEVGIIYCDSAAPSIMWMGEPHPYERESGIDLVVTLACGATLAVKPRDDFDVRDPTGLPVGIISAGETGK